MRQYPENPTDSEQFLRALQKHLVYEGDPRYLGDVFLLRLGSLSQGPQRAGSLLTHLLADVLRKAEDIIFINSLPLQ